MLHRYVSFLQEGNCRDSTIINHLIAISKWINYMIDFADRNSLISIFIYLVTNHLVPLKFLKQLEALQKGLRRDSKKKRKWQAKDQKANLIQNNCWPKQGLTELMETLKR